MSSLGPATLALSDAELRETLDLHSRVIASMSDKLDVAVAAKQQTDPVRYARHIEQELDKTIGRILDRLDILHSSFEADRRDVAYRLEDLVI